MKRLRGKVALITGANRGIGRGIAMALAAEGADIVVNDRARQEETQAVVEAIVKMGAQAMDYQADVSERAEVQSMVEAVVEQFGQLDIAVANAAYSVRQAIADLK